MLPLPAAGAFNLTASLTDFLAVTRGGGAPVAAAATAVSNGSVTARAAGLVSSRRAVGATTGAAAATALVPDMVDKAPAAPAPALDLLNSPPALPRRDARRRPARFSLETSIDSLALFEHTHQGRFPSASPALGDSQRPSLRTVTAAEPLDHSRPAVAASVQIPPQQLTARPDFAVGSASVSSAPAAGQLTTVAAPTPVLPADAPSTVAAAPPPPTAPCVIPVLPRGSKLTLSIHSTWGDPHYVG